MRGFCAALGDIDGLKEPLTSTCDWVLTQIDSQGRLLTPIYRALGRYRQRHDPYLCRLKLQGEELGA